MKKQAYVFFSGVSPTYRSFLGENIVVQKVKSFKNFKQGWHLGEGESFSDEVINQSIEMCEFLLANSFLTIDAFPGFNGEVRITAYPNNYYFEITFEDFNRVNFLIEDNNDSEIFRIENQTIEEVKRIIIEKRDSLLWNTPEYLHYITTIAIGNDSTALPLRTLRQNLVEGFPSSVLNVQMNLPVVSAGIFAINTQSEQTQRFSGNLAKKFFQPAE